MRLAAPGHLVDINRLAELAYVRRDAGGVRVGALARHAARRARRRARTPPQPLLRQALRQVAHPTIRNRGTTVGSIVARRPGRRDAGRAGAARRHVDASSADGTRDGAARRTSSSARWSRRCGRASSPWRRTSRRLPAGTRHRVRRGGAAPRRLRAVRRRRRGHARRRPRGRAARVRRCVSVGPTPGRGRPHRRRRRRSRLGRRLGCRRRARATPRSTRRTTSTPPPTTGAISRRAHRAWRRRRAPAQATAARCGRRMSEHCTRSR